MGSPFRDLLKAVALENALRYNGKALKESVVGKLVSLRPELKRDMKVLLAEVDAVIDEVNSLTIHQQQEIFNRLGNLLPVERVKEEKVELPPLPRAKRGRVVTRFSPNPDFVLHLGNARAAILSHDYARMYDGRFILRFEDTDPRTKKPRKEYYESVREDLRWLGCNWDAEYIQSLRLELYYSIAREVLRSGNAYVCLCEREAFKARTLRNLPCPDRDLSPEEHLQRFVEMLEGDYREGDSVMRIKTELEHPNPAVRDWPALRIIETRENPHPLTGSKHRVWPLYNFSCGIDDHDLGITHIIRGVEHQVNEIRQRYLYDHLGWEYPTAVHHGRIFIPNAILSKSKILEGEYDGPEDARLATLLALRRRGFQPDTIRFVMHTMGLNPSKATIEWKNLEAYNRKRIDSMASRRFVVLRPCPLKIREVERVIEARIPLHPDFPQRGYREYSLVPKEGFIEVYLDEEDIDRKPETHSVRLKGLCNVRIEFDPDGRPTGQYVPGGVSEAIQGGMPIIHWLPKDHVLNVTLVWTDNSRRSALGELGLAQEHVGNMVQMERLGYGRIERVHTESVQIVFSHA
ncbi:MAG: glutamate--tRNA ligase [Candidatus Geothermarchaeales archaeon]